MSTPILAEYPTIRTLDLGTRAHLSRSMAPWWTSPSRRGSGVRLAPQVDGGFPRPIHTGAIRFIHEVWVDGRFDVDNAVNADPREGWEVNLGLLEAACAPESDSPWTFSAVHHLPDESERHADIQVLDIVIPRRHGGVAALVALDIQIPDGQFVDVESS
jgi:hypothetical protein